MSPDPDPRLALLERRVADLEAEVGRLRSHVGTASTLAPPPAPPQPGAQPLPPPGPHAVRDRDLVPLESETLLKWGGVALVVLAVGFAVSTAISRGWIGPELQLVGAVAVSLSLIAVGLRLRPARPGWTHALCTGGVLALFTTAASDLFIDELGENPAYALTVLTGIGGMGLARHARSEWVAAATLLGGLTGWLVIADDDLAFGPTLGWLTALIAATVVLALEQRWYAVRATAHAAAMFMAMGMAGEALSRGEQAAVLAVGAGVWCSLATVPSRGSLASAWQRAEVQLAALIGPWGLAVVAITFAHDGEGPVGATALGAAAAAALTALAARAVVKPVHFVSMTIGASVAFTIGCAVLLSSTVAFVALAVQGAGLWFLSRALARDLRMLVNAIVLLFVAGVGMLGGAIEAWDVDARIGDDIAHLAIVAALAVVAWSSSDRTMRQLLGGTVLVLVLVWLGSVLVHLPEGQAAVSASWAAVGTAVLLTGAIRKVPGLGATGLAVLGLTVAKLLTVDLRSVDALWRAALFFFVGLGFLRLGFLLPRLTGSPSVDREVPPPPAEPVESSIGDIRP